jgi:hypothetical protein
MKNIITLLMLFVVTIILHAQPKPAVKTGTPVVPGVPSKPKVSPYVLKKDYDEMLLNFDAKVKSATNANAGLRNLIGRKDKEIESLGEKMIQVEEILNSTAFKVSNTEDSLDKTRFSIEEFRKSTEEKFVENLTTYCLELERMSLENFNSNLRVTLDSLNLIKKKDEIIVYKNKNIFIASMGEFETTSQKISLNSLSIQEKFLISDSILSFYVESSTMTDFTSKVRCYHNIMTAFNFQQDRYQSYLDRLNQLSYLITD